MVAASGGMARFAPTASIKPSRMMTTPFAISPPLTGCTVPPVIAYTPGTSAKRGTAQSAAVTIRKRLSIRTSAARNDTWDPNRDGKKVVITSSQVHGPVQLRHEGDHGEDRVLRSGSVWQDDQSAVHLRVAAVEQQEQDALALDENRPHPLLRLPPPRPRQNPRDAHEAAVVHGAGSGLLQLDATARAERRGRCRVCR